MNITFEHGKPVEIESFRINSPSGDWLTIEMKDGNEYKFNLHAWSLEDLAALIRQAFEARRRKLNDAIEAVDSETT